MIIKTAFPQLFSLTLVCFFVFIGFTSISPGKHKINVNPDNVYLSSERLEKTVAETFRTNYKNSFSVLQTIDKNGSNINLETFSFDARDMKEILAKINSSPGTQDKVVFKFALDNANRKRWRLLAYGMTENNLRDSDDQTPGRFAIFHNSDYAPQGTRKRKDEAEALRSMYEKSKLLNTIDKSGNKIPLYGFAFNADQIDEILNHNASGQASPDKVILYLGLEMVRENIRWHVIAYGAKSGVLLDFASPGTGKGAAINDNFAGGGGSIFDKADPCPPCK